MCSMLYLLLSMLDIYVFLMFAVCCSLLVMYFVCYSMCSLLYVLLDMLNICVLFYVLIVLCAAQCACIVHSLLYVAHL